tara:strand:+ start:1991 stop:2647 length:657 start_codon:yes stop_codon:yes gene_type:complete
MKDSWKYIFGDLSDIYSLVDQKREEYSKSKLQIFPSNEYIFRCLNYFEINETKVVIIGQDPYHGLNQSTGLAFGINNNIKIPPSLRNIKNELKSDINIDLEDQTLEKWAKQGVLLLNASLTVVQGKPGSNMNLWNIYTTNLIQELNKLDNLIFVAWGAFAHNKLKDIDKSRHKILVSSHPSPLSCMKKYGDYPCFNGSKPFSKINSMLKELNKEEINW